MRIEVATRIRASRERCFDAARDIDLHVASAGRTRERAVAGRRTGLIGLGEEVEWEGVHFGFTLRHRSRITTFSPPAHFRDEMVAGLFRSFVHDHRFEAQDGGTRMLDELEFHSPLGWLGALTDRLVLARHLRRFLERRAQALRLHVEAGESRSTVPGSITNSSRHQPGPTDGAKSS